MDHSQHTDTVDDQSAAAEYDVLVVKRQNFIMRAEACSQLTIRSLCDNWSSSLSGGQTSSNLNAKHQSLGGRGVAHLASKLLNALHPIGVPNFKTSIDSYHFNQQALAQGQDPAKYRAEIETMIQARDQVVADEIEAISLRPHMFEAYKHLLVVGNVCVYTPATETSIKILPLNTYVCRRNGMGRLHKLIIKEKTSFEFLDEVTKETINRRGSLDKSNAIDPEDLDMYTHCSFKDKKWHVYQEVLGVEIEEATGTFSEVDFPYIVSRAVIKTGEDYGRSYVEDVAYDDLSSYDSLNKAILKGASIAATFRPLVKPGTVTAKNMQKIATAKDGEPVAGNAEDITFMQADKLADFQFIANTSIALQQDLEKIFLMNSSIQRSGERVTAEEIRFMAAELETTLSGMYSLLGEDLLKPLMTRFIKRMVQTKKLEELPKEIVRDQVRIIVGIEALGRGSDLQALSTWFEMGAMIDQLAPDVNKNEAKIRVANSLSINHRNLLKTPEELQVEADKARKAEQDAIQQQGQMDMAQAAVAPAVTAAGNQMTQAAAPEGA